MFKKLIQIGKVYENYLLKRSKIEALRILMTKDDKTLEDVGISRHELLGGVQNWPWDGSATKQKMISQSAMELQAVRELSCYSDRQLHDLGINRGMIAEAVKYGRPGIDDQLPPQRSSKSTDIQKAA